MKLLKNIAQAARHVTRSTPPAPPLMPPAPPKAGAVRKKGLADPARFFGAVRAITGPLDQVQVDTINDILARAAHWPLSWVAYGLATAWHEARLRPIAEWGKGRGRPYGKAGKYGQPQYGRGLVQLTWDSNYEWADRALGLGGRLLDNFDLALRPDIAARILVQGMETGAFTGRALRHYLTGTDATREQYRQARRIINRMDKADKIAGHAERFAAALRQGGWA